MKAISSACFDRKNHILSWLQWYSGMDYIRKRSGIPIYSISCLWTFSPFFRGLDFIRIAYIGHCGPWSCRVCVCMCVQKAGAGILPNQITISSLMLVCMIVCERSECRAKANYATAYYIYRQSMHFIWCYALARIYDYRTYVHAPHRHPGTMLLQLDIGVRNRWMERNEKRAKNANAATLLMLIDGTQLSTNTKIKLEDSYRSWKEMNLNNMKADWAAKLATTKNADNKIMQHKAWAQLGMGRVCARVRAIIKRTISKIKIECYAYRVYINHRYEGKTAQFHYIH